MLSQKEIKEIRKHLEKCSNPVFFYDNDPDGFCSFILLRRYCGKGKGVCIKSSPGLTIDYFKKVEEFKSDCIFVLDKPVINPEFLINAKNLGIPVVHIDHHNVETSKAEFYYNTFFSSGKNEPVSYLCYHISEKKEDDWISAIGCICDFYIPDFIERVKKRFEGIINCAYKTPFDIRYNSTFGKICQIIGFAIKDSTTNVVLLSKFILNCNNPYDLLEENTKTKGFLKRYEQIDKRFNSLIKKAEENIRDNFILFRYSGDLSINQFLADFLSYKYPEKITVCIYTQSNIANVSLRWKNNIRICVVNAIKDIEGATGGGHENASGARIPLDRLDVFEKNLIEEIRKIEKNNQ
jgi:single-stranded DNA-specific DHH superfamily exonuclease